MPTKEKEFDMRQDKLSREIIRKFKRNVQGRISTVSGDVNVRGGIHGNVSTISGNVYDT